MKRIVVAALAAIALASCDNTAEFSPAASEADLKAAVEEIKEECS